MAQEIKYTHRTRDGRKARIICTDRWHADRYPVIALVRSKEPSVWQGESLVTYTADLRFSDMPGNDREWDLFEYNPWKDVPIDAPIWVSSGNAPYDWFPGHFAGMNARGDHYYTWANRGTSHTETAKVAYLYATLENPNATITKE